MWGQRSSFTLIELIMVIIIISILSSIAFISYTSQRDKVYLKEASTNLKLIASAEKIFRLESGRYTACNNTSDVNYMLRLSIPTSSVRWNYKVYSANNTTFTGKAGRDADANATVWCINETTEDIFNNTTANCAW